jgi:hypothetical protein
VGINPILSDLQGPGTSKLDWRYFDYNKIDRNELQIRTNSQKGIGTKMAEKLSNFEKFERTKNQISALFSTQRPPDDWPDALEYLAIGLVAYKYAKLGKTNETLFLSQGLSYMKIPLC